jgi:hypothetical protein
MKTCGEVEVYYTLLTSVVDGMCGYVHSLVALTPVTATFTVDYSYLLLMSTFFSYTSKMEEIFSPVTPFNLYSVTAQKAVILFSNGAVSAQPHD